MADELQPEVDRSLLQSILEEFQKHQIIPIVVVLNYLGILKGHLLQNALSGYLKITFVCNKNHVCKKSRLHTYITTQSTLLSNISVVKSLKNAKQFYWTSGKWLQIIHDMHGAKN